jgi:hypothetical protein
MLHIRDVDHERFTCPYPGLGTNRPVSKAKEVRDILSWESLIVPKRKC